MAHVPHDAIPCAPMTTPGAGEWPVEIEIPVAWGEMDAYGHVNNIVYLRWFESCRMAYFRRSGVIDRVESEGTGPILARTTIDYRYAVRYPDSVRASTTVTRLGNSSFTMAYRIQSLTTGKLAAEGEAVIVMVHYENESAVPIWPELRAAIGRISQLEGAA